MSCRGEWGSVVANSYGGFIFHEKLGSPRVHNIVRPEFTISANIEKSKWPFFILIYIHIFICDILNRSEEVHPQFVFIFDKWEFRKPTAMHQQSRWIKRISNDLIFGKEATIQNIEVKFWHSNRNHVTPCSIPVCLKSFFNVEPMVPFSFAHQKELLRIWSC